MEVDYEQLPRQSILCIDMKAFYASIEAVERGLDPLKVHLAVIGDRNRSGSVILAASPALKKKYKIKTGNRLYQIPDVPEIILAEARMGLYLEKSIAATRILNQFVPMEAIHVYSIDEAWMKLDGTERLFGDKWETARKIRKKLFDELGLHSSVGLGPNMFLAKVAMDIEGKRKGIAQWSYEDVPEKLWPIKLQDCWGIGRRLAVRLNKLGVYTLGDLAALPLSFLEKKFGIMGNQLYYHAWGVDLSKLEGHYRHQRKSLGKGITLLRDYEEREEVETVILELCEDVAARAREENLAGKTVSLGISYSRDERQGGFYVQRTMRNYSNLTMDLYQTCLELLEENCTGRVVRKIHVSLSNLTSDSVLQLNLFENKVKMMELARAVDTIRQRFGPTALLRARSLTSGAISLKQKDKIGGHNAW